MDTSAVSHDLIAACRGGGAIRVTATCTVLDPFAAVLRFHDGDGDHDWVVAVDTLAAGLDGLSGLGDVQVWPEDDDLIEMRLSSDDGWTVLTFHRRKFAAFVQAAVRVPRTSVGVAVDVFLAEVARAGR